ncbi:mitochondrial intermembrane space import and assembly protein 40 homolog [Typha angustifolia]|uniref:mitochondrial intermembrane space import and assembly protein 40 homolog n=1 Tax=Typha angustifolia TaxID=59011 RepID=UPI003C2E87D4
MGQPQSHLAAAAEPPNPPAAEPSPAGPSPPPASMEDLIAEAMTFGEDANEESMDAKVQKALECPCIAGLKTGPCGTQFTDAFVCFLKSIAEEKGSDCVNPFIALQNCIQANPNAFSKDILEDEESDDKQDKETPPDYKISPPLWSRERKRKI